MAYGINIRGWKATVLALALLPTLAGLVLAGPALAGGEVGTPAPDWELIDTDEVPWTMSGLNGNVVFLAMIGWG